MSTSFLEALPGKHDKKDTHLVFSIYHASRTHAESQGYDEQFNMLSRSLNLVNLISKEVNLVFYL